MKKSIEAPAADEMVIAKQFELVKETDGIVKVVENLCQVLNDCPTTVELSAVPSLVPTALVLKSADTEMFLVAVDFAQNDKVQVVPTLNGAGEPSLDSSSGMRLVAAPVVAACLRE
jgi:hypothetical protein